MAKAKAKAKAKPLKKYLVTYHAPASAMRKMKSATKEDMAAGMKAWMTWAKECGAGLVEMGAPLGGGMNLKSKGAALPSKRKVTGYSLLQAKNMAGAKKLMKGHPHLSWTKGCEIEVHEAIPMGM